MRDDGGRISFAPRLPGSWNRLRFALVVQGDELVVDLTPEDATYLLRAGTTKRIMHRGSEIELTVGEPVTVPARPAGARNEDIPAALPST